jgi:Rha family phage regulatory protein
VDRTVPQAPRKAGRLSGEINIMTEDPKPQLPRVPIVKIDVATGRIWADSRDVARFYEKEHKNVLQAIRNLNCSDEFRRLNFQPFKIRDLAHSLELTSHVEMTKLGFVKLTAGFTGEKAGITFEAFLKEYEQMEAELARMRAAPVDVASLMRPGELASRALCGRRDHGGLGGQL